MLNGVEHDIVTLPGPNGQQNYITVPFVTDAQLSLPAPTVGGDGWIKVILASNDPGSGGYIYNCTMFVDDTVYPAD